MAYNNVISRSDSQALVPEVVSNEILTGLTAESAAMTMFKHVPMSTSQTRMPVLAALPVAYFVNGDTGLKQTTEVNWANKYLNVEEIACIVPIPENVADDLEAGIDVWGQVKPLVSAEFGRVLDAAIFFGTNKPSSWPSDIVSGAVAASNTVTEGTATNAQGGVYGDLSAAYSTVEAEGYEPDGVIATTAWKGKLRNARSTQGVKLDDSFSAEINEVIKYPMRGLWPAGSGVAELIAGDFMQGIIGVRQDISWKLLDQAVIQDNTGAIIYNLPQQDMVAMRFKARFAFQIANTINYDQPTEASRYPWAVIKTA